MLRMAAEQLRSTSDTRRPPPGPCFHPHHRPNFTGKANSGRSFGGLAGHGPSPAQPCSSSTTVNRMTSGFRSQASSPASEARLISLSFAGFVAPNWHQTRHRPRSTPLRSTGRPAERSWWTCTFTSRSRWTGRSRDVSLTAVQGVRAPWSGCNGARVMAAKHAPISDPASQDIAGGENWNSFVDAVIRQRFGQGSRDAAVPLDVLRRKEAEWHWTPFTAGEFPAAVHRQRDNRATSWPATRRESSGTPRDFLRRWRGVQVNGEPGRDCWGFWIPSALREIAAAIDKSRSMLALPDNWDGEGSPAYEEATWRRAVGIVVQASKAAWRQRDQLPPVSQISKGPEGSVDILWEVGTSKALINVPADPAQATTFFAHDLGRGRQLGEGTIDVEGRNDWLLCWLAA